MFVLQMYYIIYNIKVFFDFLKIFNFILNIHFINYILYIITTFINIYINIWFYVILIVKILVWS